MTTGKNSQPPPGAPSFCTKSTPANNKILCNLTNAKFKISIDKHLEM